MCIRDRAKDADVKVIDGTDPLEAEYLYWVGCAGSFDDKNKKVSQALSKLLNRANVSFAILGPAENCTGDSARRTGNEYIFQLLAMQNIETLNNWASRRSSRSARTALTPWLTSTHNSVATMR